MARRLLTFRGVGLSRGAGQLAALVTAYAGALGLLFALGLRAHGWLGWAALITPLVVLVALRIWTWQRVAVELADGVLRYEGASARTDFELPLSELRAVYDERAPLVLIVDGREHVCADLSPSAARALYEHLRLSERATPALPA